MRISYKTNKKIKYYYKNFRVKIRKIKNRTEISFLDSMQNELLKIIIQKENSKIINNTFNNFYHEIACDVIKIIDEERKLK